MMYTEKEVQKELSLHANPSKAKVLQRFFKTGKGQYGEGDLFLGVTVPLQRLVAKKYSNLSLLDCKKLLQSHVHEYRLTALLILVAQFERADSKTRKKLFSFYLANRKHVNNWDLVDLSAPKIVGAFLFEDAGKSDDVLEKLARSKNLWDRRIAIIATYAMIREGRCDSTLALAEILLNDSHDLMHKAVGWMLREVGKRDEAALKNFLATYAPQMSRTCLRYSIERFDEAARKKYLAQKNNQKLYV